MANTTFLDLPIATSLDGTEVFPIVQPPNSTAGVSKRATVAQVAALASISTGSLAAFMMATDAFTTVFPNSRYLVTNPDFASTDGGAGAAFTIGPIATAAVTYAKFQQVPGLSVVGVSGTATGVVGAITGTSGSVLQVNAAGTGLLFAPISTGAFSGTVWPVPFGGTGQTSFPAFSVLLGNGTNAVSSSNIGSAGQLFIGQTSTSNPAFVTISGDVGFTAAGTATIVTSAVTFAKFQNVTGLSILGVTGTATGAIGAITGTASQALIVNSGGTGLVFGSVNFSTLQTMTGLSVVGVAGTATANPNAITGTANQVLVVNPGGTALLFGQVNLSSTSAITGSLPLSNLTTIAGLSILGNSTTATASVSVITGTTGTLFGVNAGGTAAAFLTVAQARTVLSYPTTGTANAAIRMSGTTGNLQTSALIIADTTGALTRDGNGGIPLQGTNTSDVAAAGFVGQLIESNVAVGSAVTMTSTIVNNVASSLLTPGDWLIWGVANTTLSGSTQPTAIACAVSTTSATIPTDPNGGAVASFGNIGGVGQAYVIPSGQRRLLIAANTTVYLSARATFTAGTLSMYGYLGAQRVR